MKPNQIDAAFARFRRSGDPDALAVVFDATAPRLLLVAMHLSRDAQAAEDLLQTTFLQAMRDRGGYNPARPVLPWLLAILHHRALDRHGRAYRIRERSAGAPQNARNHPASHEPGPAQVAEHRELHEQVARALDGLPADYRELLALRLVHGLRAVEIAHSKGVPPATVRTRLRRGLSLLRRALPRGLATPSLLALLGAEWARAQDGLAAVRRTVVAAARAQPVAVATGAGIAGAALTKWLVAGAAAALCAVLALRSTTDEPAAPTVAAHRSGGAGPERADLGAPPRGDEPTGGAATTRVAAAQDGARSDDRRTTIRGRVVSAATGAPLAGATVTLRSWQPMRFHRTRVDWAPLPSAVTDRDGTYQFVFVPPPELSWNLNVTANRHSRAHLSFDSLRGGIDARLDDVALEPGVPTSLDVIAEDGHGAGIQTMLGRSPDGLRPNGFHHVGTTDSLGHVDLGTLAAGTWFYRLETSLDGPREGSFEVSPDRAHAGLSIPLELRMPPAERSIRGTVVDERGAPVTDLELQFHRVGGYGHRLAATDRRGKFVYALPAVPERDQLYRIELPRQRSDLEWLVAPTRATLGTTDLRLHVRRRALASLTIDVVAGDTAAPVPRFGVAFAAKDWDEHMPTANELPPIESHPSGRLVLDDLRPATYVVSVHPEGDLAARTHMTVEVGEGEAEHLRIELLPPAELLVDVRDVTTGEPLVGVDVSLARMLPAADLEGITVEAFERRLALGRRGGRASNWAVEPHDRGRSDAQGQVRLMAPPDTTGLAVFATAPDRRAALLRAVALPRTGGQTTIELAPGGQVHGRVAPPEFVTRFGPRPSALREVAEREHLELPDPDALRDEYPEIELRSVDEQGPRFQSYVAPDGTFTFASLPTGRYEVRCNAMLRTPEHADSVSFGPLRTIDVTPVETVDLALDLTDRLPSAVQVRVFVDGRPWTGRIGFEPLEGTSHMKADAHDGRAATLLLPGRYRAYAVAPVAHQRCDRIFSPMPVDVAAGRDANCTLDLRRRRLVVTATDARGDRVSGRRIVPVPLDHPDLASDYRFGARTDDDGRVVFDPAPPGSVRLAIGVLVPEGNRTVVEPGATLAELGATDDSCAVRIPPK